MALLDVQNLRKLAMSGDLSAQHKLGWLHYTGEGVTEDHVKAADWWKSAANEGHANSRIDLAVMFYRDTAGRLLPAAPGLRMVL